MSYYEEPQEDPTTGSQGWLNNPLYGLDDFCYLSLAELWKGRSALPGWYSWGEYSFWTLFNVVCSLSFFVSIALQCLLYSWIGRESYGDCEDHTWVWHYSIWGMFAPLLIGSIAFLFKFVYDRVLGEPGGPEVYSLLNLVHPIGRTVMFVLGCTLWLKMVPSCTAMYYEEVPEILVLYWFMIAWYAFSAFVGWFAFFLTITQIDFNTPFVRKMVNFSVDCTPWNLIKSYSILQMNGDEPEEHMGSGFPERTQELYSKLQVGLLCIWVSFCAWGTVLLFHDDGARYGTCAELVGVWSYVGTVLMLFPILGVVLNAVREGRGGLGRSDRHSLELLLVLAHTIVTFLLMLWGGVLFNRLGRMLRADCLTFYLTTHVGLTTFWAALVFFLTWAFLVNFTMWFIAILRSCSAPRKEEPSHMDPQWYQRERAVV
mmetsp:Transcript_43167/g.101504  ORF Transcript_43167/g.101504 Transcript_43167/m.101504 type:complete len:428 (+) Transcript_43167:130-1413(+)